MKIITAFDNLMPGTNLSRVDHIYNSKIRLPPFPHKRERPKKKAKEERRKKKAAHAALTEKRNAQKDTASSKHKLIAH